MRRIWSILLVLLMLAAAACADENLSAYDTALSMAQCIPQMEDVHAAALEGMPDRAIWTDSRTDAKCMLIVYPNADAAEAAAVALGTRYTSVRAVGRCTVGIDSDLPTGEVENYVRVLAEILDVKMEEEPRYILNVNTRKFHYPECSSVDDMKESNKQPFSGEREELILQGYSACKRCKP